jgi:hypothetical protein
VEGGEVGLEGVRGVEWVRMTSSACGACSQGRGMELMAVMVSMDSDWPCATVESETGSFTSSTALEGGCEVVMVEMG